MSQPIPPEALSIPSVLLTLAAILVAAKLMGELAERIGQPAVLGELVAGVLLGASVFGIVDPQSLPIHLLAEIGVVVLLFGIGLETDLGRLLKVGSAAVTVATVGVILPFALGYIIARALGVEQLPALVVGAAMTATSVGITARVFGDLGRLSSPEGQIVLGAAVFDDVLGLIILAVVANIVAGATFTLAGALLAAVQAFGFLIAAIIIGRMTMPWLFDRLGQLGKPQTLAPMGIALAFILAGLASVAGSAPIIGAFAAGLILAPTKEAKAIESGVAHVGHFFVPIFFVAVGAAVDIRAFADTSILLLGSLLVVAAIAGKFAAGYAPVWFKGRKVVIGVGMIPRGEVGLIFAQMGLAAGVLTSGTYGAIMLMVMMTTFVTPPWLKALLRRDPRERGDHNLAVDLTTEV